MDAFESTECESGGSVPTEMLESVTRSWRRHELRRQSELACVTSFVGDVGRSLRLLTGLRAQEELAVFESSAESAPQLATHWLRRAETANDLMACAFGVLSQALPGGGSELRADWQERSSAERQAWLARQIERQQLPQVRAALLWLELSLPPLAAAAAPAEPLHELSLICAWLPRALWPVPCLSPATAPGLEASLQLALRCPSLPLVAIASDPAWLQLRAAVTPRHAKLLDEGALFEGGGAAPTMKPTVAADAELLKIYVAAREACQRAERQPADRTLREETQRLARALLRQLLEAEPVTRNLFEADAQLPLVLADASTVDLACASLRVAIELEQPSFAPARRDRKRDLWLQTHGFVVARFFADEIVDESSEVVQAIVQLVLRRAPSAPREV
jgi:very-short-patch-repair endonuclease